MAIVYLEPADLSASQAERILAFLNGAKSAQEIADAVEFPGELDIGIKLAERLLKARAEHGGLFASLEQVRHVPQIGPERFTELCAAVLELDPRHWVGQLGQFLDQQASIAARTEALSAQLAALQQLAGSVAALELSASPQPAWLGQALSIEARLQDAGGQPLANRELTLETSAGVLESSFGFVVQRGPALRVRTGADGVARLLLRFEPLEPLSQDQHAALDGALETLDAAAETPRELREAFLQLAALYDDEHEVHLRRALDIYSRHYKTSVYERLNPENAEYDWPLEPAVLRAHYHPVDGRTAVATSAVLPVAWKNWVAAWFAYLHQYLEQGAALAASLAAAKRRGASGSRLVADLIGQAHTFVAGQKGLAAEWASQRLVGRQMENFLAGGLEGVDEATRELLFPSLELAADQLRVGNAGTLALVDHTRAELQGKIDLVGKIDVGAIADLQGLREAVGADAARVEAGLANFQEQRGQLENKLSDFNRNYDAFNSQQVAFGRDYASFNTRYADFNSNYGNFNRDYAGFNTSYGNFSRDYATFHSDYGSFSTSLISFDNNLATFNSSLSGFNSNYSSFTKSYDSFSTSLASFNQNYATFNSGYTKFTSDYGAFEKNYASFNTDRASITTQLNTVLQNQASMQLELGTLKTDVGSVKTELVGVKTDVGTLKSDMGSVKTSVSGLNTDVSQLKGDMTTVKGDVATVKGDVTTLKTDVNLVKSDVSGVKTNVSGLNTELSQVKTNITGLNQRINLGGITRPGG